MFGNLFNSNPNFQSKKVRLQTVGSGLYEYIPKPLYTKPFEEARTSWFGPVDEHKRGDIGVQSEPKAIVKRESREFYHTTEKMEVLFGQDWKKIPMKDIPVIANIRLGLEPPLTKEAEITKTLAFLSEKIINLTFEQSKFLLKNDHLPKKKVVVNGFEKEEYLNAMELEKYEIEEENKVHEAKLNFYVVSTGIINAFEQLNTKK